MSSSECISVGSVSFADIPSELLVEIFFFLQALDLVSLSKTCCRFRTVIMEHDHIWNKLCYKDYGHCITNIQGWSLFSYRDIYTSVLHQYGSILGLWKMNLQYYGALIHIHVNNGRIIAERLVPVTDRFYDPLRVKPLFELTLNQSGQLVVHNLENLHQCGEKGTIEVDKDCCSQIMDQFLFVCHCKKESHEEIIRADQNEREAFQQWVRDEYSDELYLGRNPHFLHGTIDKFRAMKKALQKPLRLSFNRVHLPDTFNSCYISPGIFKGTYSTHGLELISVATSQENVVGTKITGDPNVPAGEWTFDINLREKIQEDDGDGDSRYPFHLPQDYLENLDAPSFYTARYKGFGQIAGRGFHSPERSPLIMYAISPTEMGLLWVDLRCFAMFTRAQEKFLQ